MLAKHKSPQLERDDYGSMCVYVVKKFPEKMFGHKPSVINYRI